MHKLCSICSVPVDSENASILVMGGFGNPRYVCEECSQDLDLLTESLLDLSSTLCFSELL